jgi:hypothetical protein
MGAQDDDLADSNDIITDTTPLRPVSTDDVDIEAARSRTRLSSAIKGILGRSRRYAIHARQFRWPATGRSRCIAWTLLCFA